MGGLALSGRLMDSTDERYLRASFEVAGRAGRNGNEPFGALLVGPDRELLLEGENTMATDRDCTAHAETNLIRAASKVFEPSFLARCTVYASAEPCAMCAAAIHYGGVRRIVFGLSSPAIAEFKKADVNALGIRAAAVLASALSPTEVIGPALEEEARVPHSEFWGQ